jgi:hypothetical protein
MVGQNIMKPTGCTPTQQGLSDGTKRVVARGAVFWKISTWQTNKTKTNNPSSRIDLIPLPQGVFPSTDRGTQKNYLVHFVWNLGGFSCKLFFGINPK